MILYCSRGVAAILALVMDLDMTGGLAPARPLECNSSTVHICICWTQVFMSTLTRRVTSVFTVSIHSDRFTLYGDCPGRDTSSSSLWDDG